MTLLAFVFALALIKPTLAAIPARQNPAILPRVDTCDPGSCYTTWTATKFVSIAGCVNYNAPSQCATAATLYNPPGLDCQTVNFNLGTRTASICNNGQGKCEQLRYVTAQYQLCPTSSNSIFSTTITTTSTATATATATAISTSVVTASCSITTTASASTITQTSTLTTDSIITTTTTTTITACVHCLFGSFPPGCCS